MQNITPFDPTAAASNSFIAHLPNGGWLLVINESVVGLQLFFPNTGFKSTVPPYCMRMMRLTIPLERVEWSQAYTIAGGPLNTVVGEVYEQSEWSGGEFLIPLPRLVNIGNQVNTTGSTGIKNDGNNPGTQFIESTPNDQGSSAISVNNDGSSVWKILSANIQRIFLSITRGNTGATKATIQIGDSGDTSITTLYGTVGTGSQVPAGTIRPGTFGGGGFYDITSPANGSGNPDCLQMHDGAGLQFLSIGVSRAGDTVNLPGAYLYDSHRNAFLIEGGTVQEILTNGSTSGNDPLRFFDDSPDIFMVPGSGDANARTIHHQTIKAGPSAIEYLRGNPDGTAGIGIMDNAAATLRYKRTFIGATDPATYTTVNEGDEWIQA